MMGSNNQTSRLISTWSEVGAFAQHRGWHVRRIVFEQPEDFSPT